MWILPGHAARRRSWAAMTAWTDRDDVPERDSLVVCDVPNRDDVPERDDIVERDVHRSAGEFSQGRPVLGAQAPGVLDPGLDDHADLHSFPTRRSSDLAAVLAFLAS